MTQPLWHFAGLVTAAHGTADGASQSAILGVSIDTRSIQPGELFVALKDIRDGHDFVTAAFKAGAAAALVANSYQRHPEDGALIRVDDVLTALEQIGRAARDRLSPDARVIAVTGSAGKTGTKEMLRACLARLGAVHAAEKSFNNHWGVPLTLARMPASTRFAVFEIGMNHAGEIRPLAKLVRPDAAIITTVEAVHLAQFKSVEDIADAKAEIFEGLAEAGTAIINRDNPHFERLAAAAASLGRRVLSFGAHKDADVRATSLHFGPDGSDLEINIDGKAIDYRLGIAGAHIAQNSFAVASALHAIGADVETGLAALAAVSAPQGRGARLPLTVNGGKALLIDESYNANPASMKAALKTMGSVSRDDFPRRIAVLGDMLELGTEGPAFHRDIASAIDAAGVDLVFAAGPLMRHLFDALPERVRGTYADTSIGLAQPLLSAINPGDIIMVKGSFGSRMGYLVTTVTDRHKTASTTTE